LETTDDKVRTFWGGDKGDQEIIGYLTAVWGNTGDKVTEFSLRRCKGDEEMTGYLTAVLGKYGRY
jgi:hypothetical protein